MTIDRQTITAPHKTSEEEILAQADAFYEVPSLVIPGEYNPVRNFSGVPLMFLIQLHSDPSAQIPYQPKKRVRKSKEIEENPSLTYDQKIAEACRQAREFGEVFLPPIYLAIERWLGRNEAKKMFSAASTSRRGRVKEPQKKLESDREVIRVYKESRASGCSHAKAVTKGMSKLMEVEPKCRFREKESLRRRVARLIDKNLRREERDKNTNERLKSLIDNS
jgi:hypothetical protein